MCLYIDYIYVYIYLKPLSKYIEFRGTPRRRNEISQLSSVSSVHRYARAHNNKSEEDVAGLETHCCTRGKR